MSERRREIADLRERESVLSAQIGQNAVKIDDAMVERFGKLLQDALMSEDSVMRRAYIRLLVSQVTVNDNEIVITGSKAVLEKAAIAASFDREWWLRGIEKIEYVFDFNNKNRMLFLSGPHIGHLVGRYAENLFPVDRGMLGFVDKGYPLED